MNELEEVDLLVVGAGPSGLTAALFAQAKQLRVAVVEGIGAGGQLKNLYAAKPVYNYPGSARIAAGTLADMILDQVRSKQIPVREHERVESVKPAAPDGYDVVTSRGRVRARALCLAVGMGLFEPRRMDVDGEAGISDGILRYALGDPRDWSGRKVAVFGGGNSAADNAVLLAEHGARVTLIHLLPKFQAEAATLDAVRVRGGTVWAGHKTLRFATAADGGVVVTLRDSAAGREFEAVFDRALINIGLRARLGFVEDLGVRLDGKHIAVDTEMRTSLPGIFACGDAVSYPGKVRLIVTAIGEAATAVNSADRYLKSLDSSTEQTGHE